MTTGSSTSAAGARHRGAASGNWREGGEDGQAAAGWPVASCVEIPDSTLCFLN